MSVTDGVATLTVVVSSTTVLLVVWEKDGKAANSNKAERHVMDNFIEKFLMNVQKRV